MHCLLNIKSGLQNGYLNVIIKRNVLYVRTNGILAYYSNKDRVFRMLFKDKGRLLELYVCMNISLPVVRTCGVL